MQLFSRALRSLTVVVGQESTDTLTPLNRGILVCRRRCSTQELIVETLVVSFAMVVPDVFLNEEAQVALAEHDDAIETLL